MIVDVHTHLGRDYVFEEDFPLKSLLSSMKENKIDISIVQPGAVIDLRTVVKEHNAIATLSKKMLGRIYGMANPNPHLQEGQYFKEVERCVKDLGFVAVKLHPLAHAVNPSKPAARRVFEAARGLKIPVMVHTGSGVPWSLPSAFIPLAEEFSDLNIVLAHSGGGIFASEASLAAQLRPNIYLETTWLPSSSTYAFCKTLGANRIMFGSDLPGNAATELAKFRSIGLSGEELEWCLGKTAAKVFRTPKR